MFQAFALAKMTITIKSFTQSPKGYADQYVSHDKFAFSFLSEDNKMVGPLVDCKGYLHNRLHCFINNDPPKANGYEQYKWLPEHGKVSLESTRLLVVRKAQSQEKFDKEIKLALGVLHSLEKALGLIRTKAYPVEGIPKEYGYGCLLVGSKRWMLSPVMLDLYVVLIRQAREYEYGATYQTLSPQSVPGRVASFLVKNKYAIVFGKELKPNWPKGADQHVMHEMGITNFSQSWSSIKTYWPHWKTIKEAQAA